MNASRSASDQCPDRRPWRRPTPRAARRPHRTLTCGRRPPGQEGVPLGQVGLADAGVGRLAHQRGGERVAAADARQHAPLQQLVDGAFELDGDHRGRAAVAPGPPLAQRLEGAARHGVADHRGVAQHRAGVGRQRVDAGGEHGGEVAGEQPAAPSSRAPGASAWRRTRRDAHLGQRAALHQQRDQLGQVERVALRGGEQAVLVGLRQPAAVQVGGEQPGRVRTAQRRQRVSTSASATRVSAPAVRTSSGRPSSSTSTGPVSSGQRDAEGVDASRGWRRAGRRR